jgi:Mg-chelatase subunit ChlD
MCEYTRESSILDFSNSAKKIRLCSFLRSLVVGLLFSTTAAGQLTADHAAHHLGVLNRNSPFHHLLLYNNSNETLRLTGYESNGSIVASLVQPEIPPGKFAILRIDIRPSSTKRFDEVVDLFLNHHEQPVRLHLSGRFSSSKRDQNCPDFSSGKKNLKKKPKGPLTKERKKKVLITLSSSVKMVTPPRNALSAERYKNNNLVLLVDASLSMNENEKRELLQVAFAELSYLMRPTDRIAVLAYSHSVNTLLSPQAISEESNLSTLLDTLKNQGFTNASLGIRTAFQLADSLYDVHSNNEIILATDGAFNANDVKSIEKDIIAQYNHRNIRLSIIGIQMKKWAENEMKVLSKSSSGRYIRIRSKRQAKNALKKTVKIHAKK